MDEKKNARTDVTLAASSRKTEEGMQIEKGALRKRAGRMQIRVGMYEGCTRSMQICMPTTAGNST